MDDKTSRTALQCRHRRVALWASAVVVAMVGMSFAAVPLYRVFCQKTGFSGTPLRADKPSDTVIDKRLTIRFDANVTPGFPWTFQPVQRTMTIKIGENALALYHAVNTSDHTVRGSAVFNISPEQAAPYFNKVQCFCFTEQLLQPGQSVDMPVVFFVDAEMAKDRRYDDIRTI
ncbi:MAG TPA: cytochrome c oxidase assembly protein, partial [Burkholderiaceae bacterium]|nr:cytochrome c oxidase assembly protein [Burkholderiaceae bacterium]